MCNGQNIPADWFIRCPARHAAGWKGRSVRLDTTSAPGVDLGKDIGLITATYSYSLSDEERVAVARRVTALWNFALGIPTEQIEAVIADRQAKADASSDSAAPTDV